MKNISKVISFGITSKPFWSIFMAFAFFFEVFTSGKFILEGWLLITLFIITTFVEIGTLFVNKKISGTLMWFAQGNKEYGEIAWTSWKLSHVITLMFLSSTLVLYKLISINSPLVSPISMFVWWLFYFSIISRLFFEKFSTNAQLSLIEKVKEELEKLKNKEEKNG